MIKRTLLLSLLLITGSVQAQDQAQGQTPDLEKAKQIVDSLCVACHTSDGNSQLSANPKIAQQHEAYLYKQLHDFKAWGDAKPMRENAVMSAMIAGLEESDMRALARYFSMQTLQPEKSKTEEATTLGLQIWRAGVPSKGIPACAACHGPTGSGLPDQYPRLGGQFAEYTEAQLRAFRDGVRANDPNSMMRSITLRMTDPEIRAVSDYAAGLR